MNIFKTKKQYVIESVRNANEDIQKFIRETGVEGSGYDTHVYGSILQDNYHVKYTFVSYMKKKDMHSKMVEAFGNKYKLSIRNTMAFVFEKENEEES